MSTFTDRVKELMKRDKISQKQLSQLSGISESSISRYISGSFEPRMDVLSNIAKVFNVTTSYLLGEESTLKEKNAYEETVCVVTRNQSQLTDQQKADLIKVLFKGK